MAERMKAEVSGVRDFSSGSSGQWATQQLAKQAQSGYMSPSALRNCDTLRHDEWEFIDDMVVEEGHLRLSAVMDLMMEGLTVPLPMAMGTTEYTYEAVSDMHDAYTTMDGLAETPDDRQEFVNRTIPVPITHKDFSINLRQLAASRNMGMPLDTSGAMQAIRLVYEKLESMLFNGGPQWGANRIEGYLTAPYRHTSLETTESSVATDSNNANKTGLDFNQAAWGITRANDNDVATGANGQAMLRDLIIGRHILQEDYFYGPYALYFPSEFVAALDDDFKSDSDRTIGERIAMLDNIRQVALSDQMPKNKIIMVQLTSDVVQWLDGEVPQVITWDICGGMKYLFKVMAIQVPLMKRTYAGRSGILAFE